MSRLLDEVVAEAKANLGMDADKRVDWKGVDDGLFDRIAGERRAERARFEAPRHGRSWSAGVGLVAAAAVAALVVGRVREPSCSTADAPGENAGTIVAIDGASGPLVDGVVVGSGAALKLGDVLDTRGAQVTVERAGKVTWVLEPGSRAVVTRVRGPLVIALEQGAVEAQVVPVSAGEAFAVDLDGSRVAVHGTHLRVARDASDHGRAIVDLNEGVVAVGVAPREGAVVGALVNAPAHAEFASRDALGTLTETHDPAAVRPPQMPPVSVAPPRVATPRAIGTVLRPPANERHFEPRPAATQPPPVLPVDSAPPAAPPAPSEAAIESTVADAVRACMAARPRADNVTVVVRTTLHLDLAGDGTVRSALFDPPVVPDVNACAAAGIYKTKFVRDDGAAGAVVIPIDFTN